MNRPIFIFEAPVDEALDPSGQAKCHRFSPPRLRIVGSGLRPGPAHLLNDRYRQISVHPAASTQNNRR
jgi:hypothetical protein